MYVLVAMAMTIAMAVEIVFVPLLHAGRFRFSYFLKENIGWSCSCNCSCSLRTCFFPKEDMAGSSSFCTKQKFKAKCYSTKCDSK